MTRRWLRPLWGRLVGLALVCQGHLWAAPANAEVLDERLDRSIELVVMVAGDEAEGAGILFGREAAQLYVITANHVVRQGDRELPIQVLLKSRPEQWLNASVTEHFDSDRKRDLAVLRVPADLPADVLCPQALDRVAGGADLKRGDGVFPVGNPRGTSWGMPLTPDRLVAVAGPRVSFESQAILPGHSGGALFTERGELVGMITADQPPYGQALDVVAALEQLRAWGYPVNLWTRAEGNRNLLAAARAGDVDEVERRLAECADIRAVDADGVTPLHLAAGGGHRHLMQTLLKAGAPVDMPDATGMIAPLNAAATRGQVAAAKLLLDRDAKLTAPRLFAPTPLHAAMSGGELKMIDLLLERGADVDAIGPQGRRPLHLAAGLGHVDMAERLLAAGASIDAADALDNRPLHLAAEADQTPMLRHLAGAGADLSAKNALGRTPLHLAAAAGATSAVQALIALGADTDGPDQLGDRPLHRAVADGRIETVAVLLETEPALEASNLLGDTPLLAAIRLAGNDGVDPAAAREIARLLLAAGADVDAPDAVGYTPLRLAMNHRDRALTALLLDAGADTRCRGLLHRAVELRDSGTIERLLAAGAAADERNWRGETPRQVALRLGFEELAQRIDSLGGESRHTEPADCPAHREQTPDADQEVFGDRQDDTDLPRLPEGEVEIPMAFTKTPSNPPGRWGSLHQAAKWGQIALVERFLAEGADINARGAYQATPLHRAAECISEYSDRYITPDCTGTIQRLVAAGAALNARDSDERTPLHYAVEEGRSEIIGALIAAGADLNAVDEDGRTPLRVAVEEGRMDAVRVLIGAGADLNILNEVGSTPLQKAAYDGQADIVDALIAAGADLGVRAPHGNTALHLAAIQGHAEIIESLIAGGAFVDARDDSGGTPLKDAFDNAHIAAAQALLRAGADLNAISDFSNELLCSAAGLPDAAVLRLLLAVGTDIDAVPAGGESALHRCLRDPVAARRLIAAGADVNALTRGITRQAPIHQSTGYISGGVEPNFGPLRLLLAAGADLDRVDGSGHTALHSLALFPGTSDASRLLLGAGANPNLNTSQGTALHMSLRMAADPGVIRLLLSVGADVNRRDAHGETPLLAGLGNNLGKDIVEFLIAAGADVNASDRYQTTPLHRTVLQAANIAVAKLLIEAGADVDAVDSEGATPLHLAAVNEASRYITLLLEHGADPSLRDGKGRKPVEVARASSEAAAMLRTSAKSQ